MARKKTKKPKTNRAVKTWGFVMKLLKVRVPSFVFGAREMFAHDAEMAVFRPFAEKKGSGKKSPSKRTKEHADEVSNIAYKFIGFPDDEQSYWLRQNIGGARWMWNRLKGDHDDLYREMGITVGTTPADYKDLDECQWLNDLDSYALCNAQLHYERAMSDFLSGDKGYPKFKKKGLCRDSYTTNKDKRRDNIKLENGRLTLPKIPGTIRLKYHRDIPAQLVIKSCTVCHEPSGKWTFSILCEYPKNEARVSRNMEAFLETRDCSSLKHIGLDMSLPEMYVDSDGHLPSYVVNDVVVSFRKCYRGLEDRIAREQRRLSRMVKDSNNYKKQCAKIASLHARAKQRRNDFLHQIAVRLARAYDVISIEDLDMSAMKQALRFGKSVSDNGWGTFVRILEQKCEECGCMLVKVDKWFPSSKTCSHCGHVHKELKLSDRTYICPQCGHVMDRDHQAAVNIDKEGFRIFIESCMSHKKAV